MGEVRRQRPSVVHGCPGHVGEIGAIGRRNVMNQAGGGCVQQRASFRRFEAKVHVLTERVTRAAFIEPKAAYRAHPE